LENDYAASAASHAGRRPNCSNVDFFAAQSDHFNTVIFERKSVAGDKPWK
jgi:hypothetical protein